MWLKNKYGEWFEKPDEEIDTNKIMNKKIRNQILDKRDKITTDVLIDGGKNDKTIEKFITNNNKMTVGSVSYNIIDGEYYIYRIDVDENYRRKGYGTKLMKSVQREVGDKDIYFGTLEEDGRKLLEKIADIKEETGLLDAKIYKGRIK